MLESACAWKISLTDQTLASEFNRTAWSDGSFSVLAQVHSSQRFVVAFAEVAEFLIDFDRMEISVHGFGPCSDQSIRHLFDDQILPRILAHQGELVLHAAGVATADSAILFIGASGSGKSSLAAAMHNWGFQLLGDDAIVASTVGVSAARPVYRSLRLFSDSITALVDSPVELTPVAAYTTKRNVVYPDDYPIADSLPIRAAFLLHAASNEHISLEPLSAAEACMAFVEHSFWMDPTDIGRTKERITRASALAVSVPAFQISYPREYSVLPAVRDAISACLD